MNPQSSSSEDQLENLLRKSSASVPDGGFSARVLTALPPLAPKKHRGPSRRTITYLLGTLTGLLCAIANPGSSLAGDFAALNSNFVSFCTKTMSALSDPTLLVMTALLFGSLVFAYFHEIIEKLE